MLRVGLYDYTTRRQATTPGYTNILVHTTGPFSPYTLKTTEGYIMECAYQFSKLFPVVYEQKQPAYQGNWCHPTQYHLVDGKLTPEYWEWRQKGLSWSCPVRRPNGFSGHKECVFSLRPLRNDEDESKLLEQKREIIQDPQGKKYVKCDLVQARIEIYFRTYAELVKQQPEFKELQERVRAGEQLQINEVDAPKYMGYFPYNQVIKGSIEVNETNVTALLHCPDQPFGHSLCLSVLLLGKEEWIA